MRRATQVVVIVRRDDAELQRVCRRWPTVQLVVPERDPADMKRSVQLGLEHLATHHRPQPSDRWMLAPADLPTLCPQLIDQVIEASRDTDFIVVPRFGPRRGHPVSLPWRLVPDVVALSSDEGINQLVENHPVQWLDLPVAEYPDDIDTPADYAKLSKTPASRTFGTPTGQPPSGQSNSGQSNSGP